MTSDWWWWMARKKNSFIHCEGWNQLMEDFSWSLTVQNHQKIKQWLNLNIGGKSIIKEQKQEQRKIYW